VAQLQTTLLPPSCGRINSFTGAVVEQASAPSRSAANAASLQALLATRNPLYQADELIGCPPDCRGRSSLTTIGHGGVQTIEVNPDDGVWVSQHQGHWMVELRCGPPRDGGFAVAAGSDFGVERHEEPLVCGKVRRSLGCVIAKDIRSTSLAARNSARDAARDERDRLRDEDLAKTCPPGCMEDPITRSGGRSRLIIARRIRQAGRFWVAYHIAWWWVEHKCVPIAEKKKCEGDRVG